MFQPLFDLLAGPRIQLAIEVSDQFVVVGVFHGPLPVASPCVSRVLQIRLERLAQIVARRANSDLIA